MLSRLNCRPVQRLAASPLPFAVSSVPLLPYPTQLVTRPLIVKFKQQSLANSQPGALFPVLTWEKIRPVLFVRSRQRCGARRARYGSIVCRESSVPNSKGAAKAVVVRIHFPGASGSGSSLVDRPLCVLRERTGCGRSRCCQSQPRTLARASTARIVSIGQNAVGESGWANGRGMAAVHRCFSRVAPAIEASPVSPSALAARSGSLPEGNQPLQLRFSREHAGVGAIGGQR